MTMTGNTSLSFGEAIELLKKGKMVARQGWNGTGMFIFMQIPATINPETVPKMQSLPDAVKEQFQKRFNDESSVKDEDVKARGGIYYSNQIAIVNKGNEVKGWSPSVSDSLNNDWVEITTM